MSKTSYFTKVDGKKVTSAENIVKRHGGVLGLCAIVLSSPYDIPNHVPEALMLLCEHSHDPDLIQVSVMRERESGAFVDERVFVVEIDQEGVVGISSNSL